MKPLRIDISGSMRGFQIATEQAKRYAAGLQKSLADLDVEKLGKSMAGSPTAMLKKALKDLAGSSPMVGGAIRAAFNPITAAIALAIGLLRDFSNAQAVAAEDAKKSAGEIRDAWITAQEAIYSKDPAKAFAQRTKAQGTAAAKGEAGGFDVGDETEMGWFKRRFGFTSKIQRGAAWVSDVTGLTGLTGGKKLGEEEEELRAMREQVARATAKSALSRTQKAEAAEAKKKADEEAAKKTAEEQARLQKERVRLQRELREETIRTASAEERIKMLWEDVVRLDRERFNAEMSGDANAKLTAQIEYLKKRHEMQAAQKEATKEGIVKTKDKHIDELSGMGLFTSFGAMTNPVLDINRQQLVKLKDIHNTLRSQQDIYA